MALEIPNPVRVIAYQVIEGMPEIFNIYEVAGNRANWKGWYGEIRAQNPGCKFAVERPGQIPPVRLN